MANQDNTNGDCYNLTKNQAEIGGIARYGNNSFKNVGGLGGIPPVAGSSCQDGIIGSTGHGCYDDCANQDQGPTWACDTKPYGKPGVCSDNDQINMYIINRTPYTFKFDSGVRGQVNPCPDSIIKDGITYDWTWNQGHSLPTYSCQMSTGEGTDSQGAFNFFPNSNTNQPSTVCDAADNPSNEGGGGYDSTQPTWVIYPWSAGYGYARQNYSDTFGEKSLMTGKIKLIDTNDKKNYLFLTYYLDESSGKDDNRVCGKDLKGSSEISKGNWKYNGNHTCIKVTNDCRNSYFGPYHLFEHLHPDLAGLLIWTIDVVPPNTTGTCS